MTIVAGEVLLDRRNGAQTVVIPSDMELPGQRAIVRRVGDKLEIEPVSPRSLAYVLAGVPDLDEEFPEIEELPLRPVEL
jgi:virulence-associated protein VagC